MRSHLWKIEHPHEKGWWATKCTRMVRLFPHRFLCTTQTENRIVYSEVRDIIKRTRTVTNYAYDAFGRRLIVQDNGGTALRSVYDAFTFDVLKEAQTYENGLFTDTGSAGIKFGKTGKPTGDRYRYLDDDHKDGNRYYYLEEETWKNVSSRYTGIRNVLSANNEVVSQYKDTGSEYFIVDEFGSVKGTADGYGNLNATYSYDVFGTLVTDDASLSYGYAGKSYDSATGLYNFGYRDYLPTAARFTTKDPIRDGSNWFAYCGGDPVNFVDLLGLELTLTLDKDNLTLNVVYKIDGQIKEVINVKGDNNNLRDSKITTAVKSHDNSVDVDTSRTTSAGNNPKRMPDGNWNLTGIKNNPTSNQSYGDTWISTDAHQMEPSPDGTTKDGAGYDIHLTSTTNTDGCLGIHDIQLMNKLVELFCQNEERDPGTSTLNVISNKTK